MTRLNKPVERIVPRIGYKGSDVCVSLLPCGIMSFRDKGKRTSYDIDLERVYWMAVKNYAGKRGKINEK